MFRYFPSLDEGNISTIGNPVGRTNFEIDQATHTTHKLMATPKVFIGREDVLEDMLNYVIKPGTVSPFLVFGSVGAGKTAVMMKFQDYYAAARKRARVKTISYATFPPFHRVARVYRMTLCSQVLLRLQHERRA